MRWRDQRRSENIEDQRGMSPAMAVGGGVGTLVLILLALLFGVDPSKFLQGVPAQGPGAAARPGGGPGGGAPRPVDPAEEEAKDFVSVILASTEDVWTDLLPKATGRKYETPKLRLFSGSVTTQGCGHASAAVGPFYCPADDRVYLDLSFFNELRTKFKAPGEFAQAYVVAHEVGHHIQNLLGTSRKVDAARRRLSEAEANALSVRMELQADFLAGVWAHHAQRMQNILEKGDVAAGLRAASAIGDDKLQTQARGYAVPDSFTHGSSEQRVRWFRRGLETGDVNQGDTFATDAL
ncbi:MAG: neutral zinc metallopeptidase [Isosphaeraceae bacterium]